LKGCRNQSAVVERAVNKYLNEKDEFRLVDVPTSALLAQLTNRDDCPKAVLLLIQNELTTRQIGNSL